LFDISEQSGKKEQESNKTEGTKVLV